MWYMIPKNASRTIKYHIEIAHSDFAYLGYIPIYKRLWKKYKKFAVLRDDSERFNSAYRDKVLNRKLWTEEEYYEHLGTASDPHVTPQRFQYDWSFVDVVVCINDLEHLFKYLKINTGKIEHLNATTT